MTIDDRKTLPEGWVETTLGEVVSYGQTQKAEPEEIENDAWVLELEDIEKDSSRILNRETFGQRDSKSTKNKFGVGDVLYGKLRPYLNKIVIADKNGYCTTEIIPIKSGEYLESRFIFYWLKHPDFLDYIATVSHGMNMPRLGTEAGKEAPFLLIPLAEQIRIADKLDALLSRVDAGRERLERVPKLVKRFRQSVLSAAVSGELTREWRGGGEAEWDFRRADEVCSKVQSGGTPKEGFTDKGIPFLKVYNIVNQKINFDYKPQFITDGIHFGSMRKSIASPGDVIMNIVGPPLGKVAILTDDFPEWNFNQAITVFRPSKMIISEWIYYLLSAGVGTSEILNEMKGIVGQINISLSQCRAFIFPVPPLLEQAEIVRRVEALFAIADRLEARAQAALTRYSRLTPALLAKAFRGELVPQDPTDEPASVLLERIWAQREAAGPVKKAAGRGRKPGATTPKAEAEAGAEEAQSEPKRGRGRPRKVAAETTEAGAGRIPLASSQEDAMRLLQERARAEREGKQAVQAGLFGGE